MDAYDGDVINPTYISAEGVQKYREPLLSVDNLDYRTREELNKRERTRNMAAMCCACCCFFLILFFMIPRTPLVEGVNSMQGLITSQNATSPSFVIEANYDVYNPNPYQVEVNKLETMVTIQTAIDSTPSSPVYVITGTGVWPPGESSVTVGSSSWGTVPVYYYFNGTDSSRRTAILANIKQCCTSYSTVITQGEIDEKSLLKKYHMSVNSLVTDVYCDCS